MEQRTETSVQDAIALSDSIKVRLDNLEGEVALVNRATINARGISEGDTI